jgi:hypothetical protein
VRELIEQLAPIAATVTDSAPNRTDGAGRAANAADRD